MADYKMTLTLQHESGIPIENFVHGWALDTAIALGATEFAAIRTAVQNFYTDNATGTGLPLQTFLSPIVSSVALAHRLKIYDITGHLNGTPHGSPVYEAGVTLSPLTSVKSLPSEVAQVLTLNGSGWDSQPVEGPGNTRPRQRRRGRFYFGPLNDQVMAATTNVEARPSSSFTAVLRAAYKDLNDDLKAILPPSGIQLATWSRSDQDLYPIVSVSTDNAFDTQRRRGEEPTSRTTLTL